MYADSFNIKKLNMSYRIFWQVGYCDGIVFLVEVVFFPKYYAFYIFNKILGQQKSVLMLYICSSLISKPYRNLLFIYSS